MMSDFELSEEARFRKLLSDYRIASALNVAKELGIPALLASGPRTLVELTRVTEAHPRSLFRLLRALVSVGAIGQIDEGTYVATSLTPYIATDLPSAQAIRALPGGLPHEREAWDHLRDSIITGESAFRRLHGESSWDYHDRYPELGAALHDGMASGTREWARAVLTAYSFADATVVVDVGGGRGALLAAILRAYPHLLGILFDRPAVVQAAPPWFADAGVSDRCRIIAGDFLSSVPNGGDLYLCKSILHNWDDDSARRILQNCRRVIPPVGRLVLVEPVLDPGDPNQRDTFLMDLHMLVIHGSGERTAAEFTALLASTGFRLTWMSPSGMSILEAVPT
jgi:SAM-dependent methyltransferase